MTDSPPPGLDPDALMDALGPAMGLIVTDEQRPGVRANLLMTARVAQLVLDFPLDDREDPAPVFEA